MPLSASRGGLAAVSFLRRSLLAYDVSWLYVRSTPSTSSQSRTRLSVCPLASAVSITGHNARTAPALDEGRLFPLSAMRARARGTQSSTSLSTLILSVQLLSTREVG